jgi:malate permease and related proteins
LSSLEPGLSYTCAALSFLPVPLQIAFLILLFVVGFLGRRQGWLTPAHGGKMLQLVMTVGLPALLIADVSRLPLGTDLLALPALAMVVMLVTMAAAFGVAKAWQLPRPTFGAFVISSMAINNGFLFPFVIVGWGSAAFAQLALFDLGNAIVNCTALYAVAASFGGHSAGPATMLRRMFTFPPLWGLAIALAINLSGWRLPGIVQQVLGTGGRLLLLLVILALGILFDSRIVRTRLVPAAIALRVGLGLLMGWAAVEVLGLEGVTRQVALLGCAAPIGFTVVVIANREHLDRELAASAASVSVLLGLFYVPLALWLL